MAKLAGAKSIGTKSAGTKSTQARVLSSRISYQGPVFSVTTDEVEEPGGVRARRDVIRHSGSIVILAVDEPAGRQPSQALKNHDSESHAPKKKQQRGDPFALLERKYRPAAQPMRWSCPPGVSTTAKPRSPP